MTENRVEYADGGPHMDPFSLPCDCYECVGSDVRYTEDGHRYVHNDLLLHTLGEACENCGRPKSEKRDLGTKGYFECWWCRDRAAGPFGPEAAPPTGGTV